MPHRHYSIKKSIAINGQKLLISSLLLRINYEFNSNEEKRGPCLLLFDYFEVPRALYFQFHKIVTFEWDVCTCFREYLPQVHKIRSRQLPCRPSPLKLHISSGLARRVKGTPFFARLIIVRAEKLISKGGRTPISLFENYSEQRDEGQRVSTFPSSGPLIHASVEFSKDE